MSKDAPANPEGQSDVSLFSQIIRSKTWRRALLVGALSGMAIGVLNLVAEANGWVLSRWFGVLDLPMASVMQAARYRLFFMGTDPSWEIYRVILLLAYIGYWTFIIFLLAPIYCFVCAGGVQRIRRDETCRRALMYGAVAGTFIGGANFLAILNNVETLERCFMYLDRPGIALAQAAVYRLGLFQFFQHSASSEVVCEIGGAVVYWLTIGLLLATVYSAIRVLRMRSDAGEPRMPIEYLPAK